MQFHKEVTSFTDQETAFQKNKQITQQCVNDVTLFKSCVTLINIEVFTFVL